MIEEAVSCWKCLPATTQAVLLTRFIWELPQNVLGILVWVVVRHTILEATHKHHRLFFQVPNFGVSLGSFVFWSDFEGAAVQNLDNKVHEFGHTLQSLYFGPLYLLVVGLPSLSRVAYGVLYYALKKEKWLGYYAGYPERWADDLGRSYF